MPWTQVCYQYDGSFAGFLSCVFDSYVHREEPAQFLEPEALPCSLYPLRTVEADRAKARRVYRSLIPHLGEEGARLFTHGFLTCLPERELWLWRFYRMGCRRGPAVVRDLADPVVDTVHKAVHHLGEEAHLYTGFVRFSELGGVLAGEIEPKNRVLPLLRLHFCGRFPEERFLLHDKTHHEVLIYEPHRWAILPVEDFQLGPTGPEELAFRRLWRSFYNTITIEGRYNPKCRMTHMPKRYWAMMTEFQADLPPQKNFPKTEKNTCISRRPMV